MQKQQRVGGRVGEFVDGILHLRLSRHIAQEGCQVMNYVSEWTSTMQEQRKFAVVRNQSG